MKKSMLCFIILLINSTVYSQNLQFFNVDASAFPNVKANFYAFDAAWNQQSPDKSALEIKENGLTRYIVNVTCPTPKTPTVLSSVLVMDISNSTNGKNIGIAKAAAQAWVNALPTDKSECALTSFDHFNYFNQDFTSDKNKLLTAITNLIAGGGTDYNKALIDTMCGGLIASKTGKYQKVLVLLTDGLSSSITDVSKIVTEAKLQNCKIFVIALDMKCPNDLQDITNQTGGQWFENVATESKATEIYRTILKIAQGAEPCSVLWRGVTNCDTSDVNVELSWNGLKTTNIYSTPANEIHRLDVTPTRVMFGAVQPGTSIDTTIILTAKENDYTISSIKLKIGSTAFQIKNVTFPLAIPKNTSYRLTIRYTPTDSNLCYGGFEIVSEYCSSYFSCIGGFTGKPMHMQTLKLIHPNGGEAFYVNSDTLITWVGVVPSDTVTLEYSVDNGATWNLITDKASGLKYVWKDMPENTSNQCLVRVTQNGLTSKPEIEWQKSFGGSKQDFAKEIIQTDDGGYIVAGYSNSANGEFSINYGSDDYWVIKLNSYGGVEWKKSLGGSDMDRTNSIIQTKDGGYIVAGVSYSKNGDKTATKGGADYWIVKLNHLGSIEWEKSLGGSNQDFAYSIKLSDDGGYLVAGVSCSNDGDVTENNGDCDYWIIKLNSTGNILWQKSFGGISLDRPFEIQLSDDGGYVVVGTTCSNDGDITDFKGGLDIWIVKLNSSGVLEWEKTLGGKNVDESQAICKTIDGGYLVVGETHSADVDIAGYKGNGDCFVVKLNSTGSIEWQKTYGGSLHDRFSDVIINNNGKFVIAGTSSSKDGDIKNNKGGADIWIVELDNIGNISWQMNFGGSLGDSVESIKQAQDGGFILAGCSKSSNGDLKSNRGDWDFWVIKLSTDKGILQFDQSDAVYSLVEPNVEAIDIDMKQCLVGSVKDSIIIDFIENKGLVKSSIDTIYLRGSDAGAFSLVSSLPKYTIPSGSSHIAEFRFQPLKEGIHKAEIVIVTQSDTLIKNITAEGLKPLIKIQSEIINFGKVNLGTNKDSLQVLTIKNNGTKTLTITSTRIEGPNVLDFSKISTVNNFTLKPDETKKIDLRFKPSEVGRTSGILAFYYDGVGSPAEVQLYGEGVMSDSQDLSSPANDTINVPIDWKLIWEPNTAYNSYNLQVSKDENFTEITIDTTTKLTNYMTSNLDFMNTYYWRVKAIMGSEQTNWSPVWKFTTLMDSVNLTSPSDLSKNITIPTAMTWEEGIYKKDNRLQVSEQINFSSKIMDSLISNINHSDVKNLKYYNNYFWRVRNESGDTLGYWSKIWQFKTRMSDALLVYPADTQTGLAQEINFKWNSVSGAEFYQLQISKNDQFTNLVYSRDSITTIEQFVPNLESQMFYYWRVRVWNTETIGTAYWSEVWTFTTGGNGVKDESELIQIIPNPAGDYITITLERCATLSKCGTSGEIQIYNTLGEMVISVGTGRDLSVRIDIADLPKGMYFVKVGGEMAKFVKM